MFYVYAIYTRPLSAQAQYSRSCHNICSSRYNGNLDIWTVVRLTAAKFKPLMFLILWYVDTLVNNSCVNRRQYNSRCRERLRGHVTAAMGQLGVAVVRSENPVADSGDSSGTQWKGNVHCSKPLPSNGWRKLRTLYVCCGYSDLSSV
jgi:hypothetical protein